MSIFTKIGAAVKKASKQISLKNAVKIGTPFLSMIPIVGGVVQTGVENISAAHAAKVEADKQRAAGNAEAAAQLEAQAAQLQAAAGQNAGQLISPTVNAFSKGLVTEVYAGASDGVKQGVANVSASVVDLTISQWFKNHLKQILIGLGCLIGAIVIWKKVLSKPNQQRTPRKR